MLVYTYECRARIVVHLKTFTTGRSETVLAGDARRRQTDNTSSHLRQPALFFIFLLLLFPPTLPLLPLSPSLTHHAVSGRNAARGVTRPSPWRPGYQKHPHRQPPSCQNLLSGPLYTALPERVCRHGRSCGVAEVAGT